MSKPVNRCLIGAALLAASAVAISSLRSAMAEGPLPSASASASASVSASASAAASAPPLPFATSLPRRITATTIASFPDLRSDKPKPEEWAGAEPLTLTRAPSNCSATRVREWIRVACQAQMGADVFGVRVVGGAEDDVTMDDMKVIKKSRYEEQRGLTVTFPVRRGDQRIITLDVVTFQWKAYTPDEDVYQVVQASWPEGQQGPTIVVQ